MKPTPPGWPRLSCSLYYDDAKAAIDWLCRAFGFELRLLVEGDGGRVEHSELTYGEAVIMVSSATTKQDKYPYRKSPSQVDGANTQNVFIYVDDIEAHFQRAKEAGAKIDLEPETHDYGEEYWADRTYGCMDIGGHHWWFSQRMRTGEPKKK